MVTIGDEAPEFELMDSTDRPVRLSDFRGNRVVVLYFYPKDFTPGCTVEACGFRDNYTDFVAAGAVVIGVSQDDPKTHAAFQATHKLPFTLVSDPRGAVAKLYGVKKTMGLVPGRTTFVIDQDGKVQHVFSSQLRPNKHVASALDLIRRLR
jgi:peroxiredoxin Q/BCP